MYKKNSKVIKHKGRDIKKTTLQKIIDKPEDVELAELIQVYVPDSFVIIVSPTDDIVAAYGLKIVNMNLKEKDGKKMNLLKTMFAFNEDEVEDGRVNKKYELVLNEFVMQVFKIILSIATEIKKVGVSKKKKIKVKQ